MTSPRFRRYAAEERSQMLIEAGLACLAEGGIRAFTVDNICRRAEVSRGLITHHFGSKDGLLAAVYAAAYRPLLEAIGPQDGPPPALPALLDILFSQVNYSRDSLNIWLAIWGEAATNPAIRDEHKALYGAYRAAVEAAIADHARARGLTVETGALAVSVIGLVDGLWLELCLDPDHMTPALARAAAMRLLVPVLGPLEEGDAS